jgi:hypothetical protein
MRENGESPDTPDSDAGPWDQRADLNPSWLGEAKTPLRTLPEIGPVPDPAHYQPAESTARSGVAQSGVAQSGVAQSGTARSGVAPADVGWSGDAMPGPAADPWNTAATETFTLPVHEVPRARWFSRARRSAAQRPTNSFASELHGPHSTWSAPVPSRPVHAPKRPRSLAVALPLLIALALIITFFSWVSAEPLWLAVGHGHPGTVKVTECTGTGITERCLGEFTADSGAFTAARVHVLGTQDLVSAGQSKQLPALGDIVAARMVSARSHHAYLGSDVATLNLRWLIGLGLVLLCGIGVVFASGALRLPERRERLAATGTSFAAPLLVVIGFLAGTW